MICAICQFTIIYSFYAKKTVHMPAKSIDKSNESDMIGNGPPKAGI